MNPEPHNFRKPVRLAGELEQRLTAWLRAACELARQRWAAHLPFGVEMAFRGPETARPADALARLPDPAVAYRVAVNERVHTLLVLPRRLALALVAGLLGDAPGDAPADREPSAVEASLAEYVFGELLLPVIREASPGAQPPALQLRDREPYPRWTRAFASEEKVLLNAFTLRGPFGEHEWHWLVPESGLLEHLGVATPPAPRETARPQLEAVARDIPVEVTVTLGSVQLPVSQLARLRVGDLLVLNQRVPGPLVASVGGAKKFRVWPGRVGSDRAFQIESLLEG